MEITVTNNMTLYDCLQQVSLEKYHDRLSERGIVDVHGLLSLTMQDYPSLGLTSMADREDLFRLIHALKMTVKPSPQERHVCSGKRESGMIQQEEKRLKAKEKILGVKRPREATEKSPLAVKIKTRLDDKTKNSAASRLSSLSRSAESVTVTTAGFYNYGVPSIKQNHSPVKRHQSASDVCQSRIQVCVRKRPLSYAELDSSEEDVVTVSGRNTVELCAPKLAVDLSKYIQKYQFAFDEVFDEKCTNREVYDRTAKPLIDTVFNRGKATCFAYGCTGSGKTFTMLGNEDVKGIYILAASEIFSMLHSGKHARELGLWVSFYEIYCGQLFDLLDSRSRLFAREDASHHVCIAGLTEHQIQNIEELMEVIEFGGGIRSTGSTGVNTDSSRSHAILQLELKNIHTKEQFGRFSFIDLAGCERAADVTDNDKQTRLEGAEINQSLLALKECIRALDLDSRHTPFRQSKLTQVLKDSFVGNSQTCMIANISPNKSCSENTLNTLRYADRVKELKKHMPGTSSPRPSTVSTSTYQGIEKLSPGKIPASIRKVNSVPKLGIQTVKLKESPCGQRKSSLKRFKMTDINQNIRPGTSNTQTLPLTRTKNQTSTKSSRTGVSVDVHPSIMRSNVRKRLIPSESQRPHTSPQVMTVQSDEVDNRMQTRLQYSKCKPQSTLKHSCLIEIANEERQEGHGVERTKNHTTEEFDLMDSLQLCSGDKLHVVSVQRDSSRNVSMNQESSVGKGSLGPNGPSPPSRNNRYGTAIKTRLSKLFNKGNIGDRSKEIQLKEGDLVHNIPTAVSNQGEGCLSLAQEQFVASHHTQLAVVTGLCQEEMVLLKQINDGQKDFQDYIAHLDDILTRKVTCIESLRERLSRYPAHIDSESSGKTGSKVYHQPVGRTREKK